MPGFTGPPGYVLPLGTVVPGMDDVPLVSLICAHGHRWEDRADVAGTSCPTCGHKLRLAKPSDEGRPVITCIYVPPDPCPCAVAL